MVANDVWKDGLSGLNYQGTLRKEELVQIADRLIAPTPALDSNIFQPASIDLTIGTVITKEGEITFKPEDASDRFLKLRPGEMAMVITHEELNLPLNIVGYTLPIISKSLRGMLVLSHGQIDPGYRGGLLVRILNIRGNDMNVRLTERIITVTFEQLSHRAQPYLYGYKDLPALRSEAAEIVDTTAAGAVLDIEGGSLERLVRQEISNRLRRTQARRVAFYTVAAALGGLAVKLLEFAIPFVQQHFK